MCCVAPTRPSRSYSRIVTNFMLTSCSSRLMEGIEEAGNAE